MKKSKTQRASGVLVHIASLPGPYGIGEIGDAAKKASKAYMTFVPNAAKAAEWAHYGAHMFFVGSEHGWMKAGANSDASGIHRIT